MVYYKAACLHAECVHVCNVEPIVGAVWAHGGGGGGGKGREREGERERQRERQGETERERGRETDV